MESFVHLSKRATSRHADLDGPEANEPGADARSNLLMLWLTDEFCTQPTFLPSRHGPFGRLGRHAFGWRAV